MDADESERSLKVPSSRVTHTGNADSRGKYPPPLTILSGNCSYSRFPYCMPRGGGLRSIRRNGRFVLQEVREPRQLMFQSVRQDGRLILLLLLKSSSSSSSASSSTSSVASSESDQDDPVDAADDPAAASSPDHLVDRSGSPVEVDVQTESSSSSSLSLSSTESYSPSSCCFEESSKSSSCSKEAGGGRGITKKPVMEDLLVGNFCGASQWNRNKDLPFRGILPWTH